MRFSLGFLVLGGPENAGELPRDVQNVRDAGQPTCGAEGPPCSNGAIGLAQNRPEEIPFASPTKSRKVWRLPRALRLLQRSLDAPGSIRRLGQNEIRRFCVSGFDFRAPSARRVPEAPPRAGGRDAPLAWARPVRSANNEVEALTNPDCAHAAGDNGPKQPQQIQFLQTHQGSEGSYASCAVKVSPIEVQGRRPGTQALPETALRNTGSMAPPSASPGSAPSGREFTSPGQCPRQSEGRNTSCPEGAELGAHMP